MDLRPFFLASTLGAAADDDEVEAAPKPLSTGLAAGTKLDEDDDELADVESPLRDLRFSSSFFWWWAATWAEQ